MDQHAMKKIEYFITCPVCIDIIKDPRTLPCQHSFCKVCLGNIPGTSRYGREKMCPVCRNRFSTEENFPICHKTQQMVELYHLNEKQRTENQCKKHPTNQVTLFCYTCQVPICCKCKYADVQHKYCKVGDLDRAFESRKRLAQQSLPPKQHEVKMIDSSINKIEKKIQSLKKNSTTAKKTLQQKIGPVINSLKKYKEFKTKEINDITQLKEAHLNSKLEELKNRKREVEKKTEVINSAGNMKPWQINQVIESERAIKKHNTKEVVQVIKFCRFKDETKDILKTVPLIGFLWPESNTKLKACRICRRKNDLLRIKCFCNYVICLTCYRSTMKEKITKSCYLCGKILFEEDLKEEEKRILDMWYIDLCDSSDELGSYKGDREEN